MTKKKSKSIKLDVPTIIFKNENIEYYVSGKTVAINGGSFKASYYLGTAQYTLWAELIKRAKDGDDECLRSLKIYSNALISVGLNILNKDMIEEIAKAFENLLNKKDDTNNIGESSQQE